MFKIEKNNFEGISKKLLFFSYLISIIPRLIVAFNAIPVTTGSDDVALFSSAAYLAGYDWSKTVSHAGYYGYGFISLFFWLYKITDDPYTIYQVLAVFSALIQALISPICIYFFVKYFKIKDIKILIILSIYCSYCLVAKPLGYGNEIMLDLISWLVVLIICKLCEYSNDINRKRKFTALLLLLLIYSLTIHTRSLVLIIAITLYIVVHKIIFKEALVSKIYFFIIGVGYISVNIMTRFFQNYIWTSDSKSSLRNASVKIPSNLDFLDLNTYKAWLSIILGEINTITVFTGGVILVVIITCIIYFFQELIKKRNIQSMEVKILFSLFIIFILSLMATIFVTSISWLPEMAFNWNIDKSKNIYAYKAVVYIRYFMPYIIPIILCGIAILYYKPYILNKIFFKVLTVILLFQLFWIFVLCPRIKNNSDCATSLPLFANYKFGDSVNIYNFYLISHILFCILIVFAWMIIKKKYSYILIMCSFLMIFQYYYSVAFMGKYTASYLSNKAIEGYNLIKNIEKIDNNFLDKEIYVVDESLVTDHQNYYIYQFYLMRYEIIPDFPSENLENVILFSNKDISKKVNKDYLYSKIDNNEYIFVKGMDYINMVEKCGVELENIH